MTRPKGNRKRHTRFYAPEYPCGDVSFSLKHFKVHAPRNFRNRVYKGKPKCESTALRRIWTLCSLYRQECSGLFYLILLAQKTVPKMLLPGGRKDRLQGIENRWVGEGPRKSSALV